MISESVISRREAARQLTQLLEQHTTFSFIRLGDGETWWLLHVQDGKDPPKYRYFEDKATSVEYAASTSGLEARYYQRFLAALEGASFLDYCNNIPKVHDHLPHLSFNRNPDLYRNESEKTSNILFEWTYYELKNYLENHRCLIASAEASLLKELCKDKHYQVLASDFFPCEAFVHFHQIRNNGRNYSENLDLIKNDLKLQIIENNIDTLLLSLSTGAKILCYELADELGIRAIDFGSMTRALTFAASPGYQTHRSLHNPFLFRVPINVYMPALERAHPYMSVSALTSRAQAQVVQELQNHELFRFNTTDTITGHLNKSKTQMDQFQKSLSYYKKHYRPLAMKDTESKELDRIFRRWCLKQGIGLQGKIFLLLVQLKKILRKSKRLLMNEKN